MENNLTENQTENPGTEVKNAPEQENLELFEGTNRSKLTPSEITAVQNKEIEIRDIVNERNRKAHQAKNELDKLKPSSKDKKQLISKEEFDQYSDKIRETESAEKMDKILNEIKDLQKRETLEKDDPRIDKLKEDVDKICESNVHLIGTKQLDEFKKWFEEEVDKKPQIKHLEDAIKRLKGEDSTDPKGLYPRREEYKNLQKLFEKYGLKEPTDSKYIEEEGLSERRAYRKNAEDIENQLMKGKEKGFYSQEVIKDTMRQALTAESPDEQKELKLQLNKVARLESESFTHLDSHITVGGITIRKMSQKGKDFLLNYYKTIAIDEREENVRKWPQFIEAEAQLAEDLLEIYEGNKEGFRLAMGSFQYLTFEEKEKALKEHEHLVKETADKEELDKKLTIMAAHGAIDEAARNNIIAKGEDRTQGKYKEFFEEEKNFKNKKTGEEGDLGEMKKAYELLISRTPNKKYKNLAAYEQQRKEYEKTVKDLGEYDDELDEKDLSEIQEKFDESGWTDREDLQEEFQEKVKTAKAKYDKMKRITNVTDLREYKKNKKSKEKDEEGPETSSATIKAANELLMDDSPLDALDILNQFLKDQKEKNPDAKDDPKVTFWLLKTAEYIREFGSGKKKAANTDLEHELEDEIEKAMKDEELKKDIEIEGFESKSIKGAEESERLHDNKKSAKERAEDESMSRVDETSLEGELTKDFYENSDEEFILDKEGTGEELTEIQFDDIEYKEEEVQELKKEIYHKQDRLREHRGLVDTVLKNKGGKVIKAAEAKKIHKEGDVADLEEALEEKVEENIAVKEGAEEGAEVFDLTQRIAAKRKTKEMLDKRLHEKLKSEN